MTITLATSVLALAGVTPVSTPTSNVPDVDVTPGVAGFIAIAAVAVAVIALVVDMTRRIRRVRYREEIRDRLEAEERGEYPEDGDTADDRYGRTDVGDDTERG